MKIIKDSIEIINLDVQIIVCLLTSRKNNPVNSIFIASKNMERLDYIRNILFNVENGCYVPSTTGLKFGAFVKGSSYSIGLTTTNIKELCQLIAVDNIRLVRYNTI